jgi:hypothetical protein
MMSSSSLFLGRTIRLYSRWSTQAFIYVTVFIIATGVALLLDFAIGIPPRLVVLYIAVLTSLLLLILPAAYVAWRFRRMQAPQVSFPSGDERSPNVKAEDIQNPPIFTAEHSPLSLDWFRWTSELTSWQTRMLTEFTDRQLTLMLISLIWRVKMSVNEQIEVLRKNESRRSLEYVRGCNDSLEAVVSAILEELRSLGAADQERGQNKRSEIRDEVE